jgi:hypothetical protein
MPRALQHSDFDVLLTHDAPTTARRALCTTASVAIRAIIRDAEPRFAFFGHYRGNGCLVEGDFGRTRVHHMAGMELRRKSLFAEEGSVGVLRWADGEGHFAYLDSTWLMNFPRTNWLHW